MKNFFKANRYNIFYLFVIIVYVWVRFDSASTILEPKIYPDSDVYLSVANSPITIENNWKARVPIVIPLIYKMLGADNESITLFQTSFSILAWVVLGFASSNFFTGRIIKWFSFSSVLFFSLSAEILLYDFCILSESISLSLMIFHISFWMLFIHKGLDDWPYSIWVLVSGFLWIFTRDTNALLILGISALILVYALIKKSTLNLKIISLLLIGFCLLSSNSGSVSERWVPPNIKVIEQRILTDESNLAFFEANGMPVNETLMGFAGRKEGSIFEWFETPELEEFIEWHNKNGKRVYLKYLLSDPFKLFGDPIVNAKFLVKSNPIFYYSPRGFENIFPESLSAIIFFRYLDPKSIAFTLFCVLLGLGLYIFEKKDQFVVPLLMGLMLYPHALIIWTASGGDVNRHAYQFRIQFRLTVILLFIYIVGYLVERIIRRYYSYFEKGKKFILFFGIGFAVFSLLSDFIFETGDTFSLGYAQIFLLGMGALLIIGSGYLHFSPEKLKFLLIGNE